MRREVRRVAPSAGTSRPRLTLGALAVSAQRAAVASSASDLAPAAAVVSFVAWLGSIAVLLRVQVERSGRAGTFLRVRASASASVTADLSDS